MLRLMLLLSAILLSGSFYGQSNPAFAGLPVGKYSVGFQIITITDSSRVTRPEFNYLGERNTDRLRKITVHLWYPAKADAAKKRLVYGDYCFNHLLAGTGQSIPVEQQQAEISARRRSVEGWFGKTTDAAWKQLTGNPMLARADAMPLREKFPLLIGSLRPLSTSISNEVLASNGYVVAMIKGANSASFSESALGDIPDMQQVLVFLGKYPFVDNSNTGTFGFSGAGFSQVLFAMYDSRVKALADLESGIYMDNLFQAISASNYYQPVKLRAPFLHIFSHDLSKQEKYIAEFETKTKFAKRYRVLLNQPALHHWDFAAEGYTSCIFLNNRGVQAVPVRQSFEIATRYLLNFFNATLKTDAVAAHFLSVKPKIEQTQDSLWSIASYDPAKPSPDKDELEYIIRTKGIGEAISIVNRVLPTDSSTNITQGFQLNNLGYTFMNERKYEEAIGVFKLNTVIHPGDANFFDSLAEGYEAAGDKDAMKKTAQSVIDLLDKKNTLTEAERSLKNTAEKRIKE